jgi:cation transporter-like permease
MRDWEQLIRDRLDRRNQPAMIEQEVAEELAYHLEDVFEACREKGLSEEESMGRAWAEVNNWPRLARKINEARGGKEMLKDRIMRMWLPGAVSMTLAMGILLTALWVGRLPRMTEISPRISVYIYVAWLLILPVIGAFAAYWSRRAGGSVVNRAAAALFTVATMVAILSTLVYLGLLADHGIKSPRFLNVFLSSTVGGILIPALALLLGALPFLRRRPLE